MIGICVEPFIILVIQMVHIKDVDLSSYLESFVMGDRDGYRAGPSE